MNIKGLYEKLGIDQSDVDNLRRMKVEAATHRMFLISYVIQHGGNMHGVNEVQTAKRRAKNKVARRQRKINQRKGG